MTANEPKPKSRSFQLWLSPVWPHTQQMTNQCAHDENPNHHPSASLSENRGGCASLHPAQMCLNLQHTRSTPATTDCKWVNGQMGGEARAGPTGFQWREPLSAADLPHGARRLWTDAVIMLTLPANCQLSEDHCLNPARLSERRCRRLIQPKDSGWYAWTSAWALVKPALKE